VYVLAVGTFLMLTTGFVVAGLLPEAQLRRATRTVAA
jgi:predicted MFS family arabinose efflux permease